MTGRQSYDALEREVQALRALRTKLLRILADSEEELRAPYVSARWLLEQRQDRAWSRGDLASFMGVSLSCVRSWESARTNISRRRRQQLAALFAQHPIGENKDADGNSSRCQCDLCTRCARTWRFRLLRGTPQSTDPATANITVDDALSPAT